MQPPRRRIPLTAAILGWLILGPYIVAFALLAAVAGAVIALLDDRQARRYARAFRRELEKRWGR